MCDVTLNECHMENLCVDCDNNKCSCCGDAMADCPKYHCDNDKIYDCEHCDFIKQYQMEMRAQYDDKQSPIDFFETDSYKKKNWTIRMDITMDRDMSQEYAEKIIFSALRSAGMKGHKGGIS